MEEIITNEEFKTEEINIGEPVSEPVDLYDSESSSGNGNLGTILFRTACAVVGIGAVAYMNRDKIKKWNDERKTKKAMKTLEKMGYEVYRPESTDDVIIPAYDFKEEANMVEETTEE